MKRTDGLSEEFPFPWYLVVALREAIEVYKDTLFLMVTCLLGTVWCKNPFDHLFQRHMLHRNCPNKGEVTKRFDSMTYPFQSFYIKFCVLIMYSRVML